ncbi:hypothetical protein BGZ65_004282 [Modicella reniformis]|uniref:Uncharacterized protein n=1 Tax=Modicella reniformis TaxID=1440133 RepID=A0A9P6J900_9FUNG|nr:hypothetical protein BGZ65_004282 [Modicella reniformis]
MAPDIAQVQAEGVRPAYFHTDQDTLIESKSVKRKKRKASAKETKRRQQETQAWNLSMARGNYEWNKNQHSRMLRRHRKDERFDTTVSKRSASKPEFSLYEDPRINSLPGACKIDVRG